MSQETPNKRDNGISDYITNTMNKIDNALKLNDEEIKKLNMSSEIRKEMIKIENTLLKNKENYKPKFINLYMDKNYARILVNKILYWEIQIEKIKMYIEKGYADTNNLNNLIIFYEGIINEAKLQLKEVIESLTI